MSANLDLKALRERLEASLAPDQLHAILLMWAERDVLKTELERSRAEVDRLQKLIANDGGWTLPRQILEELRAEPVEQPPKMRGKKALARLLEALTPSGATKAAYSGEFRFSFVHGVDEDGNDVSINVQVPWTTIKDVMAAIVKRATVDVPHESEIDRQDGDACERCGERFDFESIVRDAEGVPLCMECYASLAAPAKEGGSNG